MPAAHRHRLPGASAIATSCAAEIPEIDAVLGTGEVPEIVERDCRRRSDAADGSTGPAPCTFHRALYSRHAEHPAARTGTRRLCPTYIYDAETPRLLATPRHYAYVKVAEGCDYKCAFCIIPTLRGAYRSRPADSIVREARALAEPRRQGTAAHLAGHDVLRHRSRTSVARSPGCCAS